MIGPPRDNHLIEGLDIKIVKKDETDIILLVHGEIMTV